MYINPKYTRFIGYIRELKGWRVVGTASVLNGRQFIIQTEEGQVFKCVRCVKEIPTGCYALLNVGIPINEDTNLSIIGKTLELFESENRYTYCIDCLNSSWGHTYFRQLTSQHLCDEGRPCYAWHITRELVDTNVYEY